MKAYKINLKPYSTTRPKISEDGKVEEGVGNYNIRDVMPNILCHPILKHAGYRFHTIAKLAERIEKCKENHIILDASDYDTVKKCFDEFKGYGRNDAEMVHRVYEAEVIEVEEKKDKKKEK